MPRKDADICSVDSIPSLSDEQLIAIWEDSQSGALECDEDFLTATIKESFKRGIALTIDLRKGQLNFDVSEEDMRLINQESLDPWIRPNCDREDFSYILGYGQSFAGYDFAEHAGFDLGELANRHLDEYRNSGTWSGDFVTLRCCLFFEIRRQRNAGLYESSWEAIQALFKAVCAAYEAEVESHN